MRERERDHVLGVVPANLAGIMGSGLFGAALVSFAFLLLFELLEADGGSSVYTGLFTYIILPVVGTVGLLLVFLGRMLARRARERGDPPPVLGLRAARQQSLLLLAGGFGAVAVFLMSLGGVRAVEYTESPEFCGEVCHTVMEPEYTAWQHAPHASVACVDCHVGPGAASFVQAKLRGIDQVIGVVTGNYQRPIHTPIDLRDPAETCLGCHWADHDIGDKPVSRRYYLTEGFDEPWVLEMAVKVGGGTRETGFTDGAHWHMGRDNVVEYLPVDDRHQEIALVRFTDREGNVTDYRNLDLDVDSESSDRLAMERVDCYTCHNRPAHDFATPVASLNRQFEVGRLDADMPGIRWLGLELLARPYETRAEGLEAIAVDLREGIADEDPAWVEQNPDRVDRAVEVLQQLYARTRFPAMNADWRAYPNNLGHWDTPGCLRCHAGNMESEGGDLVSYECDTCHLIKGQGRPSESWQYDPRGLPFVHPSDEDVMGAPVLCHECHDGALGYGF